MKRNSIRLLLFAFIASGCSQLFLGDDPGNSAVDTFEQFWKGVDQTWPEFANKHVNWDSLHTVYRPLAETASTNAELIQILRVLVNSLRDGHTTIYPKGDAAIGYFPRYPINFYGFEWTKSRYLYSYKGNPAIAYGILSGTNIGYIYIATFSKPSDQYEIIDAILNDFSGTKGIIIDVRENGGGNSANSKTIASRFADQTKTYAYSRFRTGPVRTAMSEYISETISPAGAMQYKGKVAILTNRASYSATEDFVLMMKAFSQVIQVGDYTGGGSGSRPLLKELPNGWSYRVSSKLFCDLSGTPIMKGILPNILASVSKADSLKGKDRIIETAITELNK